MAYSHAPAEIIRSMGRLTADEAAACRAAGIELGFDPVQQAIVRLDCIDDVGDNPRGADVTSISSNLMDAPLSFRRWRVDDADKFVDFLGNERVWRYLPDTRPSLDVASAVDLINLSNEADHHDVYAVEVAGKIVGQARLLFDPSSTDLTVAEISYWLGEQHWGQGIGSRLVNEFTRASFNRWESLASIVARVHSDNRASRRALLKAGYVPQTDQGTAEWQVLIRGRS
jgi:RimJ/RimL family protein N-acetyltransferase